MTQAVVLWIKDEYKVTCPDKHEGVTTRQTNTATNMIVQLQYTCLIFTTSEWKYHNGIMALMQVSITREQSDRLHYG